MQNQKAASALIATVILVAFAISAGMIVMSFSTSLSKSQTESVSNQAVCAQKGALFIDYSTCTRVRDNSLVGYWQLNTVNGTNHTKDFSGYRNDGQLKNYAQCGSGASTCNLTTGQIGNALNFDGVDDYVNVGSGASLDNTGQISVSLWVKPNVLGTVQNFYRDILTGSPYAKTHIFFGKTSGNKITAYVQADADGSDRNSRTYTTSIYVLDTSWHYISMVWNGSNTIKIYADGAEQATVLDSTDGSIAGEILGTGGVHEIGRYDVVTQMTNGTIDEVRIYNRSLSADEILQHYQKGLEKFAVDGYFKTIKASVRNIGSTSLANFTLFADINGRLYQNDTPLNGGAALPGGSEPLTLQAYTYYDGPIKTLKVSVLNCPISMTLTNDSSSIGTC